MPAKRPTCRLCDHDHFSYEPHVLIGGPEPSKDVKRLARMTAKDGRVDPMTSGKPITVKLMEPEADLTVVYDGIGPLSPENARLLTDRAKEVYEAVRGRFEYIARVLELAHRREAWRVLRYPSWNAYIEAEFEISKRRANQLVRHTRIVLAIEEEVGTRFPPSDLPTERATRAIAADAIAITKVKRLVRRGVSPKAAVDKVTGAACEHPRTVTVKLCADCGKRLE